MSSKCQEQLQIVEIVGNMDKYDKAQETAAKLNQQALDMQLAVNKQTGPSRETCLECGEPIPAARRKASPGCELCIPCLTAQEQGDR